MYPCSFIIFANHYIHVHVAVTNYMFRKYLYNPNIYIITPYNPYLFMSKYLYEHPYINVNLRINIIEFRLISNHLFT